MEILTHVNCNCFYLWLSISCLGDANAKIFGASRHFIVYIYHSSLCCVANGGKNNVFAGVPGVPAMYGCQGVLPGLRVRGGGRGDCSIFSFPNIEYRWWKSWHMLTVIVSTIWLSISCLGDANAKFFGASRHFIVYIYHSSLCCVADCVNNDVFAGTPSVPPVDSGW